MARHSKSEPNGVVRPTPGPSFPGVERGDEIVHIDMQWLVEGAFPANTTSIIMGRKGRGKSMIAVALTAQMTAGVPFPGYSGPSFGRVLWACKEASFGEEIGPRLKLNGADRNQYYRIHPIRPDGHKRMLNLFDDNQELRDMVMRLDIRLLVLDPVEVLCASTCNLSLPQPARDYLEALNDLCRECRLTCIGMLHMTKRQGGEMLSAGYYNEQLVNAARSVLRCDPLPQRKGTYVLSKVVGNTGGGFRGLCYRFEGEPKGHPRIIWEGTTDLDAEDIADGVGTLIEQEEWREAEVFIYLALQSGARKVKDLKIESWEAGINWGSMIRAKVKLGVKPEKKTYSGGGHWEWPTPEKWPEGLKEVAEGYVAKPCAPCAPSTSSPPETPKKPRRKRRSARSARFSAPPQEVQEAQVPNGENSHEKTD